MSGQAEARLTQAMDLHRPRPTGRTEYVLGNAGEIYGVEPTYTCPEGCKSSAWFFAGDECDTWKALAAVARAYEADLADALKAFSGERMVQYRAIIRTEWSVLDLHVPRGTPSFRPSGPLSEKVFPRSLEWVESIDRWEERDVVAGEWRPSE